MKNGIRYATAVSASLSLVALSGCGGLSSSEDEENNDAESAASVEEVPALSEIDDLMWDSMEEAGSVTLTADMNALAADDPESAEIFEDMLGADLSNVQLYGSLDESASGMRLGDQDVFRLFGEDSAYLSTDAIFGMFEAQMPALSPEEQQMLDDLIEEGSGSWIDFSGEVQDDESFNNLDVKLLLADFRESWEDETSSADDALFPRTDIPDEGTHEVRDEVDVWVYTGESEDQELVLEADHESPKISSVSDAEISMTFTDWGETELPEQPDESQLMTEEDFEQLMNDLIGGGTGMQDPGTGSDNAPGEDETPGSEETPGEDESGTGSGSGSTNVPGVGTFDCDGPLPGDPGFSDPNDNFSDEDVQAIQDACSGS